MVDIKYGNHNSEDKKSIFEYAKFMYEHEPNWSSSCMQLSDAINELIAGVSCDHGVRIYNLICFVKDRKPVCWLHASTLNGFKPLCDGDGIGDGLGNGKDKS